jgi:hypothetical protein
MAAALEIVVEGKVLGEPGAGADERHVAAKDVEELREFVEGRVADDLADTGKALFIIKQVPVAVLFVVHGPELDEPEYFFVFSRPCLDKKDFPPVENGQQQDDQEDQRREGRQQDEGSQEIEDGLEEAGI